jgi:hypothetical protein
MFFKKIIIFNLIFGMIDKNNIRITDKMQDRYRVVGKKHLKPNQSKSKQNKNQKLFKIIKKQMCEEIQKYVFR